MVGYAAYGTKQIGRAYNMSDVTIYQEDTLIALLNEKNIGLADSTAKRARKPRTDDDDTGLGIAGLLDMEDGGIAADEDEPPRLCSSAAPMEALVATQVSLGT